MATTTPLNTTALRIYADGTAVLNALDASISINGEVIDITTKDSDGWSEFMAGIKGATLSGTGLYDNTATDDIWTALSAGSSVTWKFSTETSGDTYFEGDGYVTALNHSSQSYEAAAAYDFQVTISGAVTKGTVTP